MGRNDPERSDDYQVLQFTSNDDWHTDDKGQSEFTRRVNWEGESGWELVGVVDLGYGGRAAVLRRDHDHYLQDQPTPI